MLAKTYSTKWNQVPQAVRQFLLRGLIVLVAWKVLYLCFLAPARILDGPLTYSVGAMSASALNWTTRSHDYTSVANARDYSTLNESGTIHQQTIMFQGQPVGNVEDACNGLELIVLYVAFLWLLPSTLKRRIWYTVLGVIAIYIVNVARCAGISYLIIYYPQYSEFAHHYIFAFVVYAFIITLWLFYSNKVTLHAKADQ